VSFAFGEEGRGAPMNAVLLFVFLSADARPEAVEAFKHLSGTWEVVAAERDGKATDPANSLLPSKVRFTDEKPAGIKTRCDIYTIALDPKAEPAKLTATVAGGEIKGDRMLVIYKLDGDRLVLRLAYGAKEFPKGFKTASDDGTYVLELRRSKQ
jgi:uncharacterized protein (TIGR03067 family)